MNRTARGIIFWAFIVFFLVAAPLSVLYTAGFRYNVKAGRLVRTGVISITSSPRNVSISLNDAVTGKTTPYVFKRVLPGEYQVTLSRTGYHNWSGDVDVVSSQTTEIRNVTMFLESDPTEEFVREAAVLTPSPNGEYAAYSINEGGWEEIWIFNAISETTKIIDRVASNDSTQNIQLLWSADGSRLLAQDLSRDIVRIYTSSGAPVTFNESLITDAESLFWHPSSGQILYIATPDILRQYDFDSGSSAIYERSDAESVLIDSSILTFVDNGTQTEVHQIVGDNNQLIALLPRGNYTIEERDGSIILVSDKRSNLFVIDMRSAQPILLQTNANVFDWNASADLLAYSDGNEVNIYSPASHTTSFVTRQSSTINTLAWHPSGNILFVATSTNISAIEADKIAKQRFTTDLFDGQSIDTFWVTSDGKTAYFYGTVEGATGLYSLSLRR